MTRCTVCSNCLMFTKYKVVNRARFYDDLRAVYTNFTHDLNRVHMSPCTACYLTCSPYKQCCKKLKSQKNKKTLFARLCMFRVYKCGIYVLACSIVVPALLGNYISMFLMLTCYTNLTWKPYRHVIMFTCDTCITKKHYRHVILITCPALLRIVAIKACCNVHMSHFLE